MSVSTPQTETAEKTSTHQVAEGLTPPGKQGGPSTPRAARFPPAKSPAGASSRARAASMMQRSVGNARVNRMSTESEAPKREKEPERVSPRIQTLALTSPNDPSEHEAESVARSVVAGRKTPPISAMPATASSLSEAGNSDAPDTSTAAHAISNKGAGSPISPSTRNAIEPHMGADLSSARVHNDSNANKAAESISARAFTHGNDIFLGRGESENDAHLMAHEATHVVQQSPNVNRATKGAAKVPEELPVSPGVLDLKGLKDFPPPGAIAQFLEEHKGSEVVVHTRYGELAQGDLKVKQGKRGDFQIKAQPLALKHPLFTRVAEAAPGLEPNLIIQYDGKQLQGTVGLAAIGKLPKQTLKEHLEQAPDLIGLAGFSMPKVTLINKLEAGKLHLGLADAPIRLGGAFSGHVTFEVIDEKVKFEGKAKIAVKGLAEGELELQRNEENLITGKAKVNLDLPKNFKGGVDVSWDGRAITGEGKVGYSGEKLSGDVTLRLMEKGEAAALEKEKKAPPEEAGKEGAKKAAKDSGKKSGDVAYVVFGEGDLIFAFNEWLNGSAHVIVDPKGYVTIIGKITPQKEYELFEQKDFPKHLFKLEARASYGLPVVGNIFIFASVGLDAFAKLGPAKFYNIVVEGTYSTDPEKNKDFSIRGSINISAAAGLRLRAEAGAGLEILGHDIKVGAGLNGIAGIKAYAEATPVIGYREKGAPGEDKKGEFFIRGDLELAAQPFLGLSGDVFIELETPWWSPLSDKKWTWPLFDKEYPLGGSMGMLASVDYVFGSKQWPAVEFKPVEFDGNKFMTDLYHDKTKPKSAEAGEQKGEWKEKNEGATEPPKQAEGEVKPGKVGEPTPGKAQIEAGGRKGGEKPVDPNAVAADGKKVSDYQKKAKEQGKQDPVKDPKTGELKEKTADNEKNQEQTAQEKWDRGVKVITQALEYAEKEGIDLKELNSVLKSIKRQKQFGFKELYAEEGEGVWNVVGSMSPAKKVTSIKKKKGTGKGSRDNPFAITWPKRQLADYEPIWLAPSEETRGEGYSQEDLKEMPGAKKFYPTKRADVFGGETIGVTPAWQTKKGRVFENCPHKGGSRTKQRKFNDLLVKHGYDREQGADGITDGDHICELQVAGPDADTFENVWPLNESENRSSGGTLKETKVLLDDDTEKPIGKLDEKHYFIEIKDFSK